jgi:hypothetical protein
VLVEVKVPHQINPCLGLAQPACGTNPLCKYTTTRAINICIPENEADKVPQQCSARAKEKKICEDTIGQDDNGNLSQCQFVTDGCVANGVRPIPDAGTVPAGQTFDCTTVKAQNTFLPDPVNGGVKYKNYCEAHISKLVVGKPCVAKGTDPNQTCANPSGGGDGSTYVLPTSCAQIDAAKFAAAKADVNAAEEIKDGFYNLENFCDNGGGLSNTPVLVAGQKCKYEKYTAKCLTETDVNSGAFKESLSCADAKLCPTDDANVLVVGSGAGKKTCRPKAGTSECENAPLSVADGKTCKVSDSAKADAARDEFCGLVTYEVFPKPFVATVSKCDELELGGVSYTDLCRNPGASSQPCQPGANDQGVAGSATELFCVRQTKEWVQQNAATFKLVEGWPVGGGKCGSTRWSKLAFPAAIAGTRTDMCEFK